MAPPRAYFEEKKKRRLEAVIAEHGGVHSAAALFQEHGATAFQLILKGFPASELAAVFKPLADALANAEAAIVAELNAAQGDAESLGGYYAPDDDKAAAAMRPSPTLNGIIDRF